MFQRFSRLLSTLLISGISFAVMAQSPLAIGEWRTHLPYTQAVQVVDGNDKIYCLSDVSFYSYNKADHSIEKFDKVNGLSDIKVSNIAFSKQYNTLVITYDNGNIDLLKDNTIINVSDLKRKNITGDKSIYNIYLKGKNAYLSTGFSIVVLDIDKEEISDSYIIGNNGVQIKVNELTSDSTYFYAATETNVKIARMDAANLANFQNWTSSDTSLPTGKISNITFFRNQIFANWNNKRIYRYTPGGQWSVLALVTDTTYKFTSIDTINGFLAISEYDTVNYNGHILRFDAQIQPATDINDPQIRFPSHVMQDTSGILWIADIINSLIRSDNSNMERILVNGPQSTGVSKMSFKGNDLWVGTGGFSNQFSSTYSDNGFYEFSDNSWRNHNKYNTTGLTNFDNVYAVLADPNSNKIFFGSAWAGLLVYENGQGQVYDKDNSILQGKIGDANRTAVTGFAVDTDSSLWMSNFYTQKPLVKMKADGSFQSFGPPFTVNGGATQVLIDDYGQIWTVLASPNPGILVYNPTNDLWRYLTNTSGGLPSSIVYCLAKDKDGSIWVGTDAGIAVFYCPGSLFTTNGCNAQQIIVTNGGFAGYLLSTEKVTAMAIDGGNRKWVGTTNGLWLFSPDGTKQLANYTVDNSPLLNNNIACLAISPTTGEMFIGTDNGIISLRTEATEATDEFVKDEVCVFPNPVTKDYGGLIGIKCLAQNSEVKITDVRGNIVYQTTAVGGEATWNGLDYTGRKANTGVYMVFAVNADGSKSFVTKLLFVK